MDQSGKNTTAQNDGQNSVTPFRSLLKINGVT